MSGELGAVVYVCDLDRTVAFYSSVLGLLCESQSDEFAMLGCGETVVTLVRVPDDIAASITLSVPPVRREDTPVKLSFAVSSISAVRELAAAHGGVIDSPDSEWSFGPLRVCDGHDPEGNVIQVREAVS